MKCRANYYGDDDHEIIRHNFFVIEDTPLQHIEYIGLGILFDHSWCPHNDTEEVEIFYNEEWINIVDHPDYIDVNSEVFTIDDVDEIEYQD